MNISKVGEQIKEFNTHNQEGKEVKLSDYKGEKLIVPKVDLLYVQASENYVNIYYNKVDSVKYVTFRNTLSAIQQQAPMLHRAHRSYLVNIAAIKHIKGNTQNALIEFHIDGQEVPLSKSHYHSIKSACDIQPKKY